MDQWIDGSMDQWIDGSIDVGIIDSRYTKAGPLPRINPIQRVTPSHIPVAKLDRAVAASTGHHKLCAHVHQVLSLAV